jgi:large subunit ribosomal protein L13
MQQRNNMKTRTYSQKTAEVKRNWHIVDVGGQVLGRIAPKIAKLLMGKHKPTYTANIDAGDYVV